VLLKKVLFAGRKCPGKGDNPGHPKPGPDDSENTHAKAPCVQVPALSPDCWRFSLKPKGISWLPRPRVPPAGSRLLGPAARTGGTAAVTPLSLSTKPSPLPPHLTSPEANPPGDSSLCQAQPRPSPASLPRGAGTEGSYSSYHPNKVS